MIFQVLTKEILAIVVAIGRANDNVDMISSGLAFAVEPSCAHRELVIELYCFASPSSKKLDAYHTEHFHNGFAPKRKWPRPDYQ